MVTHKDHDIYNFSELTLNTKIAIFKRFRTYWYKIKTMIFIVLVNEHLIAMHIHHGSSNFSGVTVNAVVCRATL